MRPQAEHLVKRGHYAAARALLHRARAHAAACDHPEAQARCLLVEARAEAGACNYNGAITLVQQAQRIGGVSWLRARRCLAFHISMSCNTLEMVAHMHGPRG